MEKYLFITKKIHKICDLLSIISIILVLIYIVNRYLANNNWIINFYIMIMVVTFMPSWALNSKLWIKSERININKIQWIIRIGFMILAFYLQLTAFSPYFKDLSYVITSDLKEVSGIAEGIGIDVGTESDDFTFEINGLRFWNVSKEKFSVTEGERYIVKYLPNTMIAIRIDKYN